jgi:hypothetical protein
VAAIVIRSVIAMDKELIYKMIVAAVMSQSLLMQPASAQTTALERAQAFVCVATGDCMLPYSRPEVQTALVDLAGIESDCRLTTKGINSIPDRIGFARANIDSVQNLMVMMLDFKPITKKYCASVSIDNLLSAYVYERNHGGSHSATIAELLTDPKRLLRNVRGKKPH